MKLQEWVTKKGLKTGEFAALIDADISTVSLWLNDKRKPSIALLDRITKVTRGKVQAADFVEDEWKPST